MRDFCASLLHDCDSTVELHPVKNKYRREREIEGFCIPATCKTLGWGFHLHTIYWSTSLLYKYYLRIQKMAHSITYDNFSRIQTWHDLLSGFIFEQDYLFLQYIFFLVWECNACLMPQLDMSDSISVCSILLQPGYVYEKFIFFWNISNENSDYTSCSVSLVPAMPPPTKSAMTWRPSSVIVWVVWR